jgi:hypothetical protein
VLYYAGTTSSILSTPKHAVFVFSGVSRRDSWDACYSWIVKCSGMFVIDLSSRQQNSTRKASRILELNRMHGFQLNFPCSTLIFRLLYIGVSMTA